MASRVMNPTPPVQPVGGGVLEAQHLGQVGLGLHEREDLSGVGPVGGAVGGLGAHHLGTVVGDPAGHLGICARQGRGHPPLPGHLDHQGHLHPYVDLTSTY